MRGWSSEMSTRPMRSPRTSTVPEEGNRRAATIREIVVLPAPLGPSSTQCSHPVEIKMAATVDRAVAAGFSVLDDVGDYDVGAGAVICQTREAYPLTADVEAVPVWSI